MDFKRNNWNETEEGGMETFIGLVEVGLHPTIMTHIRETVGLGTEKFPFFIDYVFHYLKWTPKHRVQIVYIKEWRDVLGQYSQLFDSRHRISLRKPKGGWPESRKEIILSNLAVLAHEMVHAWQHESGRFVTAHSRGDKFTEWEGELWEATKHDWIDRPWEKEAVRMSHEIMISFIKMMNNIYGEKQR